MPHDHCHGHVAAPGNDNSAGTADLDRRGQPILVQVIRGGMTESRHRALAVIADRNGRILDYWGNFERAIYPRSAVKPLQALPLIESGAADAFALGSEELALACASHSGEPVHTEAVAAWLERIGCSSADLECGAHPPYDTETARELVRQGREPTPLHNNCSGKHTGFLTVARHKGEPLSGYTAFTHPVQQRILGVLEQMTGQDLGDAPRGIDGCSIPTIAVPLGALAMAMARLADPVDLPDRRAEAALRIRAAWGAHPYLIAGRNRFDTLAMTAGEGRFMVKAGAEGVSCAALPEFGIGIAVKIEDGAGRAADVAMAALLRHVGALGDEAWESLAGTPARPRLANVRGTTVGEIRTGEIGS